MCTTLLDLLFKKWCHAADTAHHMTEADRHEFSGGNIFAILNLGRHFRRETR